MDGERFYLEFKDCLSFLELKWGEMKKAQVNILDGKLVMSHKGRAVSLDLDKIDTNSTRPDPLPVSGNGVPRI